MNTLVAKGPQAMMQFEAEMDSPREESFFQKMSRMAAMVQSVISQGTQTEIHSN